jgi:radical SAM protein with 4Fe4S-binding SPASM domain
MGTCTEFIVGCDIRAYSKLNEDEKEMLTSHLYASHITSTSLARLQHHGFNDTGDGFYVTFEYQQKQLENYLKYIKNLQHEYHNTSNKLLSRLVSYHWLRIAAGVGEVAYIVNEMKFMRSIEIDRISRILDASKLPVPLLMTGSGQLYDRSFLSIRDKHGTTIPCRPLYLDKNGDKNPIISLMVKPNVFKNDCTDIERLNNYEYNAFYLLKKQELPLLFHDIDESTWAKFNEYIFFSDTVYEINQTEKRGINDTTNEENYLKPIYIFGHTLENTSRTLKDLVDYYRLNNITQLDRPVKLLFLDPDSFDAKWFSVDDKAKYSKGSNRIYDKLLPSLHNLNDFIKKNPILKNIDIYFSDKLISKGIHKVLDYMIVIHYGDDHLRKTASYELFNYFGTADEREHFENNMKNYFSHLIGGQLSKVKVSRAYKPLELDYMLEAFNFEEFIQSSITENLSYSYKEYLTSDFVDFISNRIAKDPSGGYNGNRQIEFHPSNKCNYACTFCQGLNSEPLKEIGNISIYEKFLSSIPKNSVEQIILSGEYSEPTFYKHFKDLIALISQQGFTIGLYTNATVSLNKVLVKLRSGLKNYIVVNLPSVSESLQSITKKVHDVENILRRIEANFIFFSQLMKDGKISKININYEINEYNYQIEVLLRTFEFLNKFDTNMNIKLTMPVVPQQYVGNTTHIIKMRAWISDAIERLEKTKIDRFQKLNIKFAMNTFVRNKFNHCYAMLDSIVIRCDGLVVPCCYTANKRYDFSYGDINNQSYEQILSNRRAQFQVLSKKGPKHVCPPCSKKDYEINELGFQNWS